DLIVANQNSQSLSVLWNKGDGTFLSDTPVALPFRPSALEAGDVEGDGDLDLVIADAAAGKVTVWTNDGTGQFRAGATVSVGESPQALFAADLDSDGDLDWVVANSAADNLSILKWDNGADTLAVAATVYSGGAQPQSVTGADFDADGDIDIAVANTGSDTVAVLLNQGDGTFSGAVPFAAGPRPVAVLAADVDGDGPRDLVVVNQPTSGAGTISVLVNTSETSGLGGRDLAEGADANGPYVAAPIPDVTVNEDSADSIIDLFAAFEDPQDPDSSLTFTVSSNTNSSLFTATSIDGTAGTLTLDYAPDAFGTAEITVRATDPGGQYVEDTFLVTVNAVNDAPVVNIPKGYYATDEGQMFAVSGSFVDVDTNDTWTATVDYGDGSGVQALSLNPDKTFQLSHRYADEGTYWLTVNITDGSGETASDTAGVFVWSVAPTVNISGTPSVDEGSAYTLNLSASDPGSDTITGWTIDWGDGTVQTISGNPSSVTHVYDDGPNTYAIKAIASDEDGAKGIGPAPEIVADFNDDMQGSAPAAGWSYLWNKNGPIGDSANYVPLIWSGVTYDADGVPGGPAPGDGKYINMRKMRGHPGAGVAEGSAVDRYAIAAFTVSRPGFYRIVDSSITPWHPNGNGNGIELVILVNNTLVDNSRQIVPPQTTASFDQPLGLLSTGDTVYVAIGPNSNSGADPFSLDFSLALDPAGLSVEVRNTQPVFDLPTQVSLDISKDPQLLLSALPIVDAGADTWTGTVDYGDGSGLQSLAIDQTAKTFSLSHTYAQAGTYTVTVTISDDDGGTHSDQLTVYAQNPPVAQPDDVSTDEDTPIVINVLADNGHGPDTDPDNNINVTKTIALTVPTAGTLTNNGDGTFTFDPRGQFDSLTSGQSATATFTYQIEDANGAKASATVTITVTGVNDAPVANDDTWTIQENTPLTVSVPGVLANDSDVDGRKSYSEIVLADGPLAYWRLGESSGPPFVDATGNGRNLTSVSGNPEYGQPGAIMGDPDTAIRFDGQA
ncbi:MAG: tandem-95 repeat protein, partial [Planctomycetes bacterium]|nr:tandem-95 repeat protein [Planctomycetota bacterium]